ncbi:MAG: cell division protein FtsL [Oscillospiraceae bacterium]|nr:cell division protein FtsL [Oscillospiraceae bacterium]
MYIYGNTTSMAYDLSTFDMEEIAEKKKSRPQLRVVPLSNARHGSWFMLLIMLACIVATAAVVIFGKVQLNEINAANSVATVQLEEANKENARLQAKLDSMVTPAKIEEYAQNELGLSRVQRSQEYHLSANTERIIEVAQVEETDMFSTINSWFNGILEYLGFV